jgi:hypothetical protein
MLLGISKHQMMLVIRTRLNKVIAESTGEEAVSGAVAGTTAHVSLPRGETLPFKNGSPQS